MFGPPVVTKEKRVYIYMCVYQAHTTPRPLGINRLWSDSPVVNGRRKERERENDVRQKSIGRTRVSFPGMIFAFQTFLFYLVLSVFWTISKKFVWEAGSQSYKLWIMNQKTPKRFRWKKFFFFFFFQKKIFFNVFLSWQTRGLTSKPNRRGLCRLLWTWGQDSVIKFSLPLRVFSYLPTWGTASCMGNMRIILRLQAGTARRTPIECAPLKKRQIEPGRGKH